MELLHHIIMIKKKESGKFNIDLIKLNIYFRVTEEFTLDINELALFSGCLASTDILISQSVTRYKLYPTLFTIILGAGLWNDSIVVVMDQVFSQYLCPLKKYTDAEGKCHNPENASWSTTTLYEVPL